MSHVSQHGSDPGGDSSHVTLDIRRLQQLVVKDELTRLYNRRYFRHRLVEEYRRSKRHRRPFSLIMADVNDFKDVNDRCGHPMGDRVLVEVAKILSRSVREIDIVCRYAGDEFVVILPDIDSTECRVVVERIVQNMASFPWSKRLEDPVRSVSLSMGYAVFPGQATTAEEVLERADRALYRAKKLNRAFCAYGEEMETSDTGGHEAVTDGTHPMVGYMRERKELNRLLEQVKAGSGQVVLIRGEHGVGKSELLGDVEGRARQKGFIVLKGSCQLETQDIPFHPLIQVARSFLNGGSRDLKLTGLPKNWMRELNEIITPNRIDEFSDGSAEKGLREELCQEEFRIFEIFSSFFHTISSAAPLLLSLENLQWADPSSVRLLQYIGRQIRDDRLLICSTTRDTELNRDDGVERDRSHELKSLQEENILKKIHLSGLNDVEVFALIDKIVPDVRIEVTVKERMFHLSGGNPLFLKEIVSYILREKRDLLTEPVPRDKAPLFEIIPPTLQDLFEQVLVDLDPEIEAILSFAAVIGQEFDFSILMAISGKNEGYILDIIDMAVRRGLIKELDQEEADRYIFTPYIVGRVLYGRLSEEKRRVLHKKVAEVLEVLHSKSLPSIAGILSYHFRRAGEFDKAVRHAEIAGEHAQELYAHQEAVVHYTSALEMLNEAFVPYPYEQAASFYGKRGRRWFALGDSAKCIDDFRSMLTCSREAGRKDLEGKAMVYLSSSLMTRGKLDEAREWAESALQIGQDLQDNTIMMLALSDLGGVNLYQGSHEAALAHYRESLRLSRVLEDERAITRNLTNIGVYYWFIGDFDEAVRHYERAIQRLEKTGDKHLLALNMNNMGAVHYMLGRFQESIEAYQESIVLTREIRNKALLAYNYNNIGEIYQVLGRIDLAEKYHGDAMRIVKQVGERYVESDILRNIGINHHLRGRTTEGLRYLKNATRFARKAGKINFMLSALYDLGRIWLENGQLKKAKMICEELARLATESGTHEALAKSGFLQSRILFAGGDRKAALDKIDEALAHLPLAHNVFLLWQAYALKWSLCRDRSDGKEALESAVTIIREIETDLENPEIRDSFLNLPEVKSLLSAAA
jgi:diguanylate cyclase (GGDEF)-like protein